MFLQAANKERNRIWRMWNENIFERNSIDVLQGYSWRLIYPQDSGFRLTTDIMSTIPQKKYRKDHISDLPETVLSLILSTLPIKDAVRTSVLSKSWKYKWTSVHIIDIHDKDTKKEAFVNFMNRILVFLSSIKDLSLSCVQLYEPSCITSWISAALKHDTESLKVKFTCPGVILPCSLLSGKSLRKLELNMPCTLKVWSHIWFTNLKSLYLEGVQIQNELSEGHTVKFSFPVLETLALCNLKWLNVESVEIDAPALTVLKSKTDDGHFNQYPIKIIGSGLQKFETSGAMPENFILTGPRVLHATFECDHSKWWFDITYRGIIRRVTKQLKSFPHLEELKFNAYLLDDLAPLSEFRPPTLRKLVRLCMRGYRTSVLLPLLHAAPSLKCLSIDMEDRKFTCFNTDEDVPSCVVSHLEEVRICNFRFNEPNLRLVKFLLKNGMQLKKFHLSGSCDTEKDELLEQLLMFPKCSACSIIAVISK